MLQVGFQPHAGGVQGDSLGEGQDGLYVQLVGPLAVLVHLRQGEGFVQLVLLVLVGLLVDRLLVDEGFEELILAALQLGDLALGGLPLGFDVLLPGVPDVEDDPSEESQKLGTRPELLQEAQELGFQLLPWDVRAAAVGFRRAVVVGVALIPAFRPGAGERRFAVGAGHKASERKVRVVALLRHDQAVRAEEALTAPEGVFVHQGRPVAGGIDVPGGLGNPGDVELVREHLSPLLRHQLASPQRPKALGRQNLQDLHAGVEARGEALEAEPHQRRSLGVELHALAVRQVAQGRPPDPLAATQGLLHAGLRPAAADLVVELREGREDPFHELAGGRLVDRLAHRPQGDAEPGQVPADDRVIECVAGKPVHVRHHEDVDFLAALVLLAQVGQGGLKLGPVGRLGGLAPLQKDPVHLPAVQAAEGSALVFLNGEGKVEGLLFTADSTVDDCPE